MTQIGQRVTITHPTRPSVRLVLGPPTRDEWSRAMVSSAGYRGEAGMMMQALNLVQGSARIEPATGAEAARVLDAAPALALDVYTQLYLLAGGATVAPAEVMALPSAERRAALDATSPDAAQAWSAWPLDLAALLKAATRMRELDIEIKTKPETETSTERRELAAIQAEHGDDLAAVQAAGIDAAALERVVKTFTSAELRALRHRELGVFLHRSPGLLAAIEYASASAGTDPFGAMEALVIASVEHPAPTALAPLLERAPGLTMVLAREIKQAWLGGVQAVIKKG
jgi:hypothetical protein